MAAEASTVTFIYRGGGRDAVPRDAMHIIMHESVTVISANAFFKHPNIIEVYCHAGVKKIENEAFFSCPRLKQLILPGVEEVGISAFYNCEAIEYLECPKLERIGAWAFENCTSLSSIDLPSAKVVEEYAFSNCARHCAAMKYAKFGENLETVGKRTFAFCPALERITIPLKIGLFEEGDEEDCDATFQGCTNLKRVDLVEAEVLAQTIAALNLEEWRNDMTAEIDSINLILPNADAGWYDIEVDQEVLGEKTSTLQDWIERTLIKITRYKAQHVQLLKDVNETLQHVVPNGDIVMNNALSFLGLPTHTFDGENVD